MGIEIQKSINVRKQESFSTMNKTTGLGGAFNFNSQNMNSAARTHYTDENMSR